MCVYVCVHIWYNSSRVKSGQFAYSFCAFFIKILSNLQNQDFYIFDLTYILDNFDLTYIYTNASTACLIKKVE